jgi:Zn-dependent peptidase ImmA (M78 family)
MSNELRMDLADCGSPEKLIGVILKHHPEWVAPVPIEELALKVGIVEFRELEADGFEGALLTDAEKNNGVILTKAGAREERRRFTIGHELGHFLMPSHKGSRQCTASDLRESRRDNDHRRQETEANRFSAGLLMPKPWFVRDMNQLGDADVTHAQTLAKRYRTSLEATVNRYIELTDDKCAYVFSKDGVIRYVRRSDDFPRLAVKSGDELPRQCASLAAPSEPLRVASSWSELDGSVWLETTWGTRLPTVLEQSVRQKDGYQISLLFIAPDADDDETEEGLEDSWTPKL